MPTQPVLPMHPNVSLTDVLYLLPSRSIGATEDRPFSGGPASNAPAGTARPRVRGRGLARTTRVRGQALNVVKRKSHLRLLDVCLSHLSGNTAWTLRSPVPLLLRSPRRARATITPERRRRRLVRSLTLSFLHSLTDVVPYVVSLS